jgi:hypothetical protein
MIPVTDDNMNAPMVTGVAHFLILFACFINVLLLI